MKIRVNHGIVGYVSGAVIEVPADNDGTPLDPFWRKRLRDSRTDGCCEVVLELKAKNKRGVTTSEEVPSGQ